MPMIYLLSLVRDSKVLTSIGISLAVVLLCLHPTVSEAGKRIGATFLAIIVLGCASTPSMNYNQRVVDVVVALAFSNVFSIIGVLFPTPCLALFQTRRQIKIIRKRLASLLRAFDRAFSLSEEVHKSMIEQVSFVRWSCI